MMRWLLLVVSILCITACSHRAPLSTEPVLGKYYFNYSLTRPSQTGLIQVFDDGENTYLKFISTKETPSLSLIEIYQLETQEGGDGGKVLAEPERKQLEPESVSGNMVTVKGVYRSLIVLVEKRESGISRIEQVRRKKRCRFKKRCHL